MHKLVWILLAGLVAGGWQQAAAATPPSKRYDATTDTCRSVTPKNYAQGFKIFREFCKQCHNRESDLAKFLHSESKMPRAWNRVFAEGYPECATNGTWDQLSIADLLTVNDYLFKSGAFTFDPNKVSDCG